MAQLNPNFEIDFSDINSYEQIQLINDTQLAKENLLMHRAYKEPSDDEIIRNHFSSFTFVDFCPKVFSAQQSATTSGDNKQQKYGETFAGAPGDPSGSQNSLRYCELESFSDLFTRINAWLKLNKDWRVVSMETLVYDCTTQFNHLKSSIHSHYLPQNTRGLRLFLSPSKSRFSGPQKIGCINVVPRKLSGSYTKQDEPIVYETLDDILQRLNELLLTRPIEGRILSVETITLPMVNGHVNTESNYFMDSRLNLLNQTTYNIADASTASMSHLGAVGATGPGAAAAEGEQCRSAQAIFGPQSSPGHTLIDILRVYYEFGPMVCGLVNLIDFVPRFYPSTVVSSGTATDVPSTCNNNQQNPSANAARCGGESYHQQIQVDSNTPTATASPEPEEPKRAPPSMPDKIATTESLTRLIRRSLAWFESERKRVLYETGDQKLTADGDESNHRLIVEQDEADELQIQARSCSSSAFVQPVNLRLCNLQVHQKTMLKSHLIQVNASNALQSVNTRMMAHERMSSKAPIVCAQCSTCTSSNQVQDWCSHLAQLSQQYHLKFVRLAYVVPVYTKYAAQNICSLRPLRCSPSLTASTSQLTGGNSRHSSSPSSLASQRRPTAAIGSSRPTGEPNNGGSAGNETQVARGQDSTDLPSLPSMPSSSTASSSTSSSSSSSSGSSTSSSPSVSRPSTPPNHSSEPPVADTTSVGLRTNGSNHPNQDQKSPEPGEPAASEGRQGRLAALSILERTNERHRRAEEENQFGHPDSEALNESPIGQLTYRLFAPCQLVKSSSCFSINPVNSSSPLARRGSVDLNGSGLSSENAHPSTLLLGSPATGSHHLSSIGESQSVVSSFGAFFPTMSHDIVVSNDNLATSLTNAKNQGGSSSTGNKFTTNEFESVEAIRRRMEIYVTTNSMKVIAGETLIVNLSDILSCLSSAIEQTVAKALFAEHRRSATWVSVYVLYAAVEEPQLPKQLLAQQKLRELSLINEEVNETSESDSLNVRRGSSAPSNQQPDEALFNDEFNTLGQAGAVPEGQKKKTNEQQQLLRPVAATGSCIRIEDNQGDSSFTLYNSAYDRTVALPTQPENHMSQQLEPLDFLGSQTDCLLLDEMDLFEEQYKQQQQQRLIKLKNRKRRKRKPSKNRHEESQCSIM